MTKHFFPQAQTLRSCLRILTCACVLAFTSLAASVYADAPLAPAGEVPAATQETVAQEAETQVPVTQLPVTSANSVPVSAPAPAPASAPAAAGYYQAGGAAQTPGTGGHLFSVTLALLFIVFLIVAVSWFVRRFGQGVFATNTHIKIIATLPLGTRERLLLVDIAGQQLLLGVTAQQINNLHVFSEPVVDTAHPPAPSEFSQKLMALLQAKIPAQQPIAHSKNNPSAPE